MSAGGPFCFGVSHCPMSGGVIFGSLVAELSLSSYRVKLFDPRHQLLLSLKSKLLSAVIRALNPLI